MKKLLLSACAVALGALASNAQEVVYYSENFDGLEPWVKAGKLGDPVGTNDPSAPGLNVRDVDNAYPKEVSHAGPNGCTVFQYYFDKSIAAIKSDNPTYTNENGFTTRIWENSAYYDSFSAYDGYLRVGGSGNNAGLRLPKFDVPDDETELYMEFDWCPVPNKNQEYTTVIEVEHATLGVLGGEIKTTKQTGDAMAWEHVVLDLFDLNENFAQKGKAPIIENSKSAGQQKGHKGSNNFYLDNIRVSNTLLADAGVRDIIADTDKNAPVEFYNLQGVRVANPENGLYIRRQGNRSTKILINK